MKKLIIIMLTVFAAIPCYPKEETNNAQNEEQDNADNPEEQTVDESDIDYGDQYSIDFFDERGWYSEVIGASCIVTSNILASVFKRESYFDSAMFQIYSYPIATSCFMNASFISNSTTITSINLGIGIAETIAGTAIIISCIMGSNFNLDWDFRLEYDDDDDPIGQDKILLGSTLIYSGIFTTMGAVFGMKSCIQDQEYLYEKEISDKYWTFAYISAGMQIFNIASFALLYAQNEEEELLHMIMPMAGISYSSLMNLLLCSVYIRETSIDLVLLGTSCIQVGTGLAALLSDDLDNEFGSLMLGCMNMAFAGCNVLMALIFLGFPGIKDYTWRQIPLYAGDSQAGLFLQDVGIAQSGDANYLYAMLSF